LIGEKFRAAPGMAAPVNEAALAVQPIEFIKRIVAAANIINVSLRMKSPVRFSDRSTGSLRSVYPFSPIIVHQPEFDLAIRLRKFSAPVVEPAGSIDRLTRLRP
jgi:hypothetical protein